MFPSVRDKPLLSTGFFSTGYLSTNKILLPIIFVVPIPADYHWLQRKGHSTVIDKFVNNSMQKDIFMYFIPESLLVYWIFFWWLFIAVYFDSSDMFLLKTFWEKCVLSYTFNIDFGLSLFQFIPITCHLNCQMSWPKNVSQEKML